MSREQDVRDAVDRFLARVRQDADGRLEALAAELLQVARGDARTSRLDVERAAVDVARAVAKGGTHARHDLVLRIVGAVRRLDEAASLRGILDVLADNIQTEAVRGAVLVVGEGAIRGYRHHGFGPGQGPTDVSADSAPVLTAAVHLQQMGTVTSFDAPASVPAFMRVATGQIGVILPLVVSAAVVALVYVEGPDRPSADAGRAVWAEHVEVLVRHAAARLENVTSRRTVEVLTTSS